MKEIILTNGGKTQVDDKDYDYLIQWNWRSGSGGYAIRSNGKYEKAIFMHHEIAKRMGLTVVSKIDHKDRNKLNNQRNNLRLATALQNQQNHGLKSNNTSGYKGVSFDKTKDMWYACISINKTRFNLGHFKTAEEAARRYDAVAKIWFAFLNFPEEH